MEKKAIENILIACEVDLAELKRDAIRIYEFENYKSVSVNKMLVNRIRKNINSRLLWLEATGGETNL